MKIHLIGAGGIGMSGVAQLFLAQGDRVSGSDSQEGPLLEKVRQLGGKVSVGHNAHNIDHPDLVVYSSSIAPQNPELVTARNRKIPVLHRGQAVAKLVASRRALAVTGAHGKSTTAGLMAELLIKARRDPLVILGAEAERFKSNARAGEGPEAVIEADESDGSLLWLKPHVALITNIDEEHLDYFRNVWELRQTYTRFAESVLPEGAVIGCADDPELSKIIKSINRRRLTFGLSRTSDFRATAVTLTAGKSRYRCLHAGKPLGEITLPLPGVHNVVNSLGVVALAHFLEIDFKTTQRALAGYPGAKRRFQIQGEVNGTLVAEDYAHHPAELQAVLEAARTWKGRRVRCIFEPHRYSRTKFLFKRFGESFLRAHEVLLLPIYAASEEPLDGLTDKALLGAIRAARRKAGLKPESASFLSSGETLAYLERTAKPKDLILFLGAGSINRLAPKLIRCLKTRRVPR